MDLLKKILARAKADKQRIVLPEATEERTLKAADKVLADELADIIFPRAHRGIRLLIDQFCHCLYPFRFFKLSRIAIKSSFDLTAAA